jgi:hypothetical protein
MLCDWLDEPVFETNPSRSGTVALGRAQLGKGAA